MRKVLLFDFDGTIADSFDKFLEIVKELSGKYRLPTLSRTELESFRSEDAKTLIKKLHIPFYKIPFLARDMKRMQGENISSIKPFPDIPQILHALKKEGYKLGIVTSNAKENVEQFLQKHDLAIFTYIYSDSSIFGKDKVLLKYMKDHSIDRSMILYIGDEIRDIHACKKIGIPIIAVTWGYTTKAGLLRNTPDFIVDSPTQLPAILHQ